MNKMFLLIGLLTSNFCFSCSSEDWVPTTQQYLESCDSIFTARLIEAKYIEGKADPIVEGTLSSPVEIFKGNPNKVIGLRTGMEGTSCEGSLDVGKIYLICAKNESYVSVAQCDLTMPIEWGSGRWVYGLFKKQEKPNNTL